MDCISLRRAFRARPGTEDGSQFAEFLGNLATSEPAWQRLVTLLDRDVVPIVSRCHPDVETDEISSVCVSGAFETWIREWVDGVSRAQLTRTLLRQERHQDALEELSKHRRFRGRRAPAARLLWTSKRWDDAVSLVEGTQSARSYFISRTRAQIGEAERKQRRQTRLMSRNCLDQLGLAATGNGRTFASPLVRSLCGAELEGDEGERGTWCLSALPPAQLVSHEMAVRVRQILGSVEELGPDHARVFRLLLEGLSQKGIAKVEGRHPSVISRRIQNLRELCRTELLE